MSPVCTCLHGLGKPKVNTFLQSSELKLFCFKNMLSFQLFEFLPSELNLDLNKSGLNNNMQGLWSNRCCSNMTAGR